MLVNFLGMRPYHVNVNSAHAVSKICTKTFSRKNFQVYGILIQKPILIDHFLDYVLSNNFIIRIMFRLYKYVWYNSNFKCGYVVVMLVCMQY